MRVEFYVSKEGDDGGPGTRKRPFATIEHARQRAREVGEHGIHAEVYVRSGPYWISARLIPGRAA